jgi:hypothetical protein
VKQGDFTSQDVIILFILGFGLLARLVFISVNYDIDWEPDGYNHVIIAKSVYAVMPGSLGLILSVWAKPVYTFLFATLYQVIPGSWPAVVVTQVVNALFWMVSGWLTLRIARDLFARSSTLIVLAAIIAFTFVSFRASITANTEPLGTLIFAVGLYLWHRAHVTGALVAFGLEILARTDAGFCVVVFAVAALIELLRSRPPGWIKQCVVRGLAFSSPLLVWNLFGYCMTGSPLYIRTHGYPMSGRGFYGFGSIFHYVVEFLKFDTILFVNFYLGAVLIFGLLHKTKEILVLSAISGVVYWIVMTVMWHMGAFGSAGLLRYFVFAYPAYILVAGVGVERILNYLEANHFTERSKTIVAASMILVTVLQLHWLLGEPRWYHSLLTRVPNTDVRLLPTFDLPWKQLEVYSDNPVVAYYLGKNSLYYEAHPLAAVRNSGVRGIFVFVRGWSETWSGLDISAFAGLTPVYQFGGPSGEEIKIFVR